MSPDPCTLWFLVGLALILLEFAAPGVILIFIGMGAWVTSLTCWLGLTDTLASQTTVFAIASTTLLLVLSRLFRDWFMGLSKNGNAQDVDEEFLTKEARVVSAINEQTNGKVEFKGAHWNARSSETLSPGDTVIITAREGLLLTVKPR